MRHKRFWIILILALIVPVLLVAGVATYKVLRYSVFPYTYTFPNTETHVSEASALEVSKKALIRWGADAKTMSPRKYWYDKDYKIGQDRYFARNLYNPNNGYVLWRDAERFYSVSVVKKDRDIVCKVHLSK